VARAPRVSTRYPGIYQRDLPGGRVYDITFHRAGRKQWEFAFPTKEAAASALLDRKYEARHGQGRRGRKVKLVEFVAKDFLPHQETRVHQGDLASSTLGNYRRDIAADLVPAFGHLFLDAITLEDVERWQGRLARPPRGLSNHTIRRLVNTLSAVLEMARRRGHVSHNPVHDVKRPKARSNHKATVLNFEGICKLAKCAPTLDARHLILVAACAGLRFGEAVALRWDNVCLDEGDEHLLVVEHFYRGELMEAAKTPAGARRVELSPIAIEALTAQHVVGRSSSHRLVFPASEGGYLTESNFNRRVWQPTREAAGLPGLWFHDLRSSFVSHARNMGLPPALTEQLAGHSDARVHRGYTQLIPGTEPLVRAAFAVCFPAVDSSSWSLPGHSEHDSLPGSVTETA